MRVAILGSGYVGLTTAVTLAYLGHDTTCVDVDERKIALLNQGRIPIHEPGLLELLTQVRQARSGARELLAFTTSAADAVRDADVVCIAVGTPSLPGGAPDLRQVQDAAHAIGQNLGDKLTVVVNKSTVPIGSGNWVDSLVREAATASGRGGRFCVASNPEFLREGSALHDTFYPDRVVVGADDRRAIDVLYALYQPIIEQTFVPVDALPRPEGLSAVPLLTTDLASAELIKYSANAFLSLKISFINEIAELAERVGADVQQVAHGIGLDARISHRFLSAGLGWGGSCFGKDTAALVSTAQEYGLSMPVVQAAREVNYRQRARIVERLLHELKILKGRTIGLLGLAYKPHTDDLRDAPSLDIARRLLERGARVRVHDPVAMPRARTENEGLGIDYCDTAEGVAAGADALVLVTEWPQYQRLDWAIVARSMRTPLLLDGRNFLSRTMLAEAGFTYRGVGR